MLGNLKDAGLFDCGRFTPLGRAEGGEVRTGKLRSVLNTKDQRIWTRYRRWWEVPVAFKPEEPARCQALDLFLRMWALASV